MMMAAYSRMNALFLACSLAFGYAQGQQCSPTLTAKSAAPSLADGYAARLVANNLTKPRGIIFDKSNHLLVVEQGVGITALTISNDGCATDRHSVITDKDLNHGIEVSDDGKTLYASSNTDAWRWQYDGSKALNTSAPQHLLQNMKGSDHSTRTLLLSKSAPGMLVVSRGSTENIDPLALNMSTGISQVKAFNLSAIGNGPYTYATDGLMLGWGLRNEVGIAEEPTQGGIWGVENSADQVVRSGQDIHQNNPAEKLNFLGYLNGQNSSNQGRNFGYPECFAAWDADALPAFAGQTGTQFALAQNATTNDGLCSSANRQAPRLTFASHMAPLDIKFNPSGTNAWVTFHGSWDRDSPLGYKVSVLAFDGHGQPVEPSTSRTAARDIMANPDLTKCPQACFRPVGLAWDAMGKRLFVSSDTTGEIWVLERKDGKAVSETGNANATGTVPSLAGPTPSGSGADRRWGGNSGLIWGVVVGLILMSFF